MSMLTIFENPLDASKIRTQSTDHVLRAFLEIKAQYPQARIYKGQPCPNNDVTPTDKKTALYLLEADADAQFYVVCHAGAAVLPYIYYAVVALIAAYSLYTILTMPKAEGTTAGSSNNELSERANKQRIGARVADIYGTVKAIPDLIAQPYSYYNSDGIEIEECLMCLGRGYYQITDVQDGDTAIEGISGAAASFYYPGSSIIGSAFYQAGAAFTELPKIVKKCSAINGQSLTEPNETVMDGDEAKIYFTTGGVIHARDTAIDFTDYFEVGDGIQITGASFAQADASLSGAATVNASQQVIVTTTSAISGYASYKALMLNGASILKTITHPDTTTSTQTYDISGTYTVSSVTQVISGTEYIYTIQLSNAETTNYNWSNVDADFSISAGIKLTDSANKMDLDETYTVGAIEEDQITVTNASSVNSDWAKLPTLFNGTTIGIDSSASVELITSKWVGWYDLYLDGAEQAVFNLYFPSGLYNVTSESKTVTEAVRVTMQYQMIDENGDELTDITEIVWAHDVKSKDSFGLTKTIQLPQQGNIRFRLCKSYFQPGMNPVHAIKIKDVYLLKSNDKQIYDDVTIVRTKTLATDGALSVKERQLNCIATRMLYSYATGQQSTERVASHNFADIICAMTTDELIGRRSIDTLDIASLYATAAEVNAYFGVDIQFNYTFDDAKMSYEETLATIASSVFCDARRESNVVYFAFEKPQDVPVLLFNHRNKVPNSEKRTSTFGVNKDYDGVTLSWTDSSDSWSESEINLPDDTVINPQKIDATGVTNYEQAYLLAYRAYNKLLHQRQAVEFQAYHEADMITRNDLLLVADDTRPKIVGSGAVIDQEGLRIYLSQNAVLEAGKSYVIHLQLPNRTVDVISASGVAGENESVLLARAPTSDLILEYEGNISCSQYVITEESGAKRDLGLVTEKSTDGTITMINYTDRYYANDKDFI